MPIYLSFVNFVDIFNAHSSSVCNTVRRLFWLYFVRVFWYLYHQGRYKYTRAGTDCVLIPPESRSTNLTLGRCGYKYSAIVLIPPARRSTNLTLGRCGYKYSAIVLIPPGQV